MPPASLIDINDNPSAPAPAAMPPSPADAARRMFQRVLCAWASDVMYLRARGLTTPRVDQQPADRFNLAAPRTRTRRPARTRNIAPKRQYQPINR